MQTASKPFRPVDRQGRGMVLGDGEARGISGHIRIRFADRGQRSGVPVAQLTADALDPAPAAR